MIEKQREGKWVKVMNHRECSECRYNAPYKKIKAGYHLQDLSKFCPNCGAKMKGEETPKKVFSPEEVRKMSPREVRDNYGAIMESMKGW